MHWACALVEEWLHFSYNISLQLTEKEVDDLLNEYLYSVSASASVSASVVMKVKHFIWIFRVLVVWGVCSLLIVWT